MALTGGKKKNGGAGCTEQLLQGGSKKGGKIARLNLRVGVKKRGNVN